MILERAAPAKINLNLEVLGRRDDGYHEVRTLLQTIDLVDVLRVAPAPRDVLELRVHPPGGAPSGGENLVLQAAEALRRRGAIGAGATIRLEKRIPVGSGLGGGSSDAAATLVLLDELWCLRLQQADFLNIAAELGSDVSFFLVGGLALATGRGELLQPLPDLGEYGVVVCAPPIEVCTAEVYDRLSSRSRLTSGGPNDTVEAFATGAKSGSLADSVWRGLTNDLEPVVIEAWPEVGRAVAALKATDPMHAAVSGSGAASFAIYPDLAAAWEASRALEDRWNVRVATTTGRRHWRQLVKRIGQTREELE